MEVARLKRAVFVFTEKTGEEQIWSGRFDVPEKATFVHVEDLITTTGTVDKVHNEMIKAVPNIQFSGINGKAIVLSVVHRPERLMVYPNYEVVSLIEQEVHSWEQSECPICKKGSEPLKPKPNWAKFQYFIEMNVRK